MRKTTWKTLALAALLGPAIVSAGCKSDGDVVADPPEMGDVAQPVVIIESASGTSAALTDLGVMLIKTQAEYDALGEPDIFPGEFDFDQYDLVIVALGQQPSGGYSVDITSIQQAGDKLLVNGTTRRPGEDEFVTTALTYPYDAAMIANTSATWVEPHID